MRTTHVRSGVLIGVIALAVAFPVSAQATHAWANYHWGRTANPFTVKVVDSMTSDWDDNLSTAISDWNQSTVMDVTREAGDDTQKTRKRCAAVSGKVRACNANYGYNGWLGLARIWVSGSHITQGVAKMNDSYLASGYTETNRQHVICQEIGHDWGLDHQDESGADLNTCMDYSRALDNPHPNQHDYAELEIIYAHLDSASTIAALSAGAASADAAAVPASWGTRVSQSANGRSATYVLDLGGGRQVLTFVTWAR